MWWPKVELDHEDKVTDNNNTASTSNLNTYVLNKNPNVCLRHSYLYFMASLLLSVFPRFYNKILSNVGNECIFTLQCCLCSSLLLCQSFVGLIQTHSLEDAQRQHTQFYDIMHFVSQLIPLYGIGLLYANICNNWFLYLALKPINLVCRSIIHCPLFRPKWFARGYHHFN